MWWWVQCESAKGTVDTKAERPATLRLPPAETLSHVTVTPLLSGIHARVPTLRPVAMPAHIEDECELCSLLCDALY